MEIEVSIGKRENGFAAVFGRDNVCKTEACAGTALSKEDIGSIAVALAGRYRKSIGSDMDGDVGLMVLLKL